MMKELVIQSDVDNLGKVEDFVCALCDEKNIHNYFAVISMAVLQAVENAIVHGNRGDHDKRVKISCANSADGVALTIEDEGAGFDFESYGDIPAEGCAGVGIFMMKMLANGLEFSDGGRRVSLHFRIDGIDEAVACERVAVLKKFYKASLVEA